MALLTKPSKAAYASLMYITLGALTLVWSGIWYWFMRDAGTPSDSVRWYWCYGFLATGLVLLVIGLGIGQIGRAARQAELPPPEAAPAEAQVQATAAAHPPAAVINPAPLSATAPAPTAAVPVQPATPVRR